MAHRNTIRAKAIKAELIERLGGKCELCPSRDDLQFDHRDGSDWVLNKLSYLARMNLYKREVELTATLEDGEDPVMATKLLQARAEGLVEDHKQGLLKSIEELRNLTERAQEVQGLQRQLESAQNRLNEIRKENPDVLAGPSTAQIAQG